MEGIEQMIQAPGAEAKGCVGHCVASLCQARAGEGLKKDGDRGRYSRVGYIGTEVAFDDQDL